MTRYYYKVVNKNLRSCWGEDSDYKEERHICTVQYKLNEFVYPNIPHSQLYVFDTLDDAKHFYHQYYLANSRHRIYKAECINPTKKVYMSRMLSDILTLWTKRKNHQRFTYLTTRQYIPYGTIAANAVKLIERVL